MTIDKDFPGLRTSQVWAEDPGYYTFHGDIKTSENMLVKVPLYIHGSIEADGWIKFRDDVNCKGSIKSGWWLYSMGNMRATGSISASGRIFANLWIDAGGSIEAGEWIRVARWIQAGEVIKLCGVETKTLYCISGTLIYYIWVMDNHLKIEGILKTKKEWLQITPQELKEIDYHGTIRKNIEFVRMLCKC